MIDIIALATGIAAHRRIGSSESNITSQNKKLDETALSTLSMRQDIEKLFLIVEALWAIVKETSNLKDEDLAELIRQIDLQDGRLDGRNSTTAEILKCAKCGKTLLHGQTRCAYRGEELRFDSLFRHNGK